MSSVPPFNFPIVITQNGLQPQSPVSIQQQLISTVAATNPGYTANLPGSLIEDISSTDVAAIVLCNQAQIEAVNSLTPLGSNEFTLSQLGTIYLGQSQPGLATNTSVNVVFTGNSSAIGYVIPNGLIVGDGTNIYQVKVGGVITGSMSSSPITAICTQPGSFGVGENTVTTIQTSVPSSLGLTVTNPTAGTPGGSTETWYSFRSRILQAGLAACVGSARFIKTLVGIVTGVQSNLISAKSVTGGIQVIAGGGNAYEVANAIFSSVADPGTLVGSLINPIRNITVTLNDYPNTVNVVFVNPPVQTVTMTVTWNTSLSTFTGGGAFSSLVQQPLVSYINSVPVGTPINILEMNAIFAAAVSGILNPILLTRLVFAVYINSTLTAPGSGTYAVSGDPESSFYAVLPGISVIQG